MQAIVYREYGSPDVLRVEQVPKPEPSDHELVIRLGAAAVTSTDCTARSGKPWFARLGFGIRRPKQSILGTEFSGTVEAAGRSVTRFKEGDEVFGASGTSFGAHAEYLRAHEDAALALKPAGLTHEEAAAVCEGGLTALPFLRDLGDVRSGQAVLINGASGAVGTAAVQLARAFGAEVTAVCGPAHLDLVKSLGASIAIDYTTTDFTTLDATYAVIFDAVGKRSFSQCRSVLEPGGIYLTTVPSATIFPHMLLTSRIGNKRARITFTGLRSAEAKRSDLQQLREMVEVGQMRAVVDRSYPLDQIADAHRYVDGGHKAGTMIVTMGMDEEGQPVPIG